MNTCLIVDSSTILLLQYLSGCQQLVQLQLALEDLHMSDSSENYKVYDDNLCQIHIPNNEIFGRSASSEVGMIETWQFLGCDFESGRFTSSFLVTLGF